jgi:arabinofuranan 3-O-arabinosyltransferase
LESIRNQSYIAVELVVVDNFSDDDTAEIAKEYANTFEACGPERSAQRNRGAKLAHGDYLLFVDSDMRLDPRVIDDCLIACAASEGRPVIIPEYSDGQGFWAKCRALEKSCYLGDDLVEAARFIPRPLFEAVGGFDEELIGGEDWDLSARVSSGKRFPRSHSRILHDEGTIHLREALAKKRYYASSFRTYWRKHPSRALLQGNVVARAAFLRNWRLLASHPVLTSGLLLLKSLEAAASIWGVLFIRSLPPKTRG